MAYTTQKTEREELMSSSPAPTSSGGTEYDQLAAQTAAINAQAEADRSTIKTEHDASMLDLQTSRDSTVARISGLYDEIRTGMNDNMMDANALLSDSRNALKLEISKLANSYNNQAAREAERVDALVAGGALGGNAYRAYQAHTATTRDLMAQAGGQIAAISLSAIEALTNQEILIESTNQQYFLNASQTLASVAATEVEAMVSFSQLMVDETKNFNDSIVNLYNVSLSSVSEQNDLYLATRELNNQIFVAKLGSATQIEVANINAWSAYVTATVRADSMETIARIETKGKLDYLAAEYTYTTPA